jgi:hypothetical protein
MATKIVGVGHPISNLTQNQQSRGVVSGVTATLIASL